MANPLFNLLNGTSGQNGQMAQFQKFMEFMKGKDPNAIINEMIQSGKLTQAQLDQVQAQAKQMQGQFNGLRKMFGL